MMSEEKPSHGLPRFRPHELAAVKLAGYAAVVVLDVAGRVMIGASGDPNRYVRNIAAKAAAPVHVIRLGWAPDAVLARHIRTKAGEMLEPRRVGETDLFDVPDYLAVGAVDAAAGRIGVRLIATETVLIRGDVIQAKHKVRMQAAHAA